VKEILQNQVLELYESDEDNCFYFYTPFCGTCKMASKMLEITEAAIEEVTIYKINLNLAPYLSKEFQIESVPCLIITKNGKILDKLYAFRSVTELYNKFSSETLS
jgi:thioredoxin-like negative regulator of GroEL